MAVNMKESGRMIKNMVKAYKLSMVKNIKDNLQLISIKVREPSLGQMVRNMRESGKTM
jgi:hypothetical protein